MDKQPLLHATSSGTDYALLPPYSGTKALLLLFATTAAGTLTTEPYCLVGRRLHARGWNVASLDLPCHGNDARPGEPPELQGWAARTTAGEDVVAPFRRRVNDVIEHMIAAGLADPARIAAAGTSRGGFMAFHAAAGSSRIRAVAAFAPVTDVRVLSEFAGQDINPLARQLDLLNVVAALAGRAAWISIGNADTRVGTGNAVAFARALTTANGDVTLRVRPVPGHTSEPHWHDEAAGWLTQKVTP